MHAAGEQGEAGAVVPKKLPWLRLHTEIVDDPKLAAFTGDEFRVWVFLMCMARESTAPGTIGMDAAGVAWRTRLPADVVERAIAKCEQGRMLSRDEHTITLTNWSGRQYDKRSDTPKETGARQKKRRDKNPRHADVTPESRAPSVQIQSQSTETEEKQSTATASAVVAEPTPAAPGQSVLLTPPEEWPPELEPIRKHLAAIEAPGEFSDPAYWRQIDAYLGKHPRVAYLDELAKYLNNERGKNKRRQHKNLRSGFSNWLRTAERIADREDQKRQQWQARGR